MNLEKKYIDLILNSCMNIEKSKSLFISYDKVNVNFVDRLIEEALKLGFNDIKKDEVDINLTVNKLLNLSDDEILNDPYFDKSIWNEYALKGSNFLMLETEFPHFMDNVDSNKVSLYKKRCMETRKIFREKETLNEIPWCIAALPNKYWAEDIFESCTDAYGKLMNAIYEVCLVNTDNPIKSWDKYLNFLEDKTQKLNNLEIRELHYTNDLGTDLYIEMPKNHKWMSMADDRKIGMFVNLPSYEVFSSPSYLKTRGIVYSSKPLMYGGKKIENFYLKFMDGKVIDFDAKTGKEVLEEIINTDDNSAYLGEVALVNYSSPISNTGIVFGTTLLDENASCHLALGDGFNLSIPNGESYSDDKLKERGINRSKTHVDFMIGTSDLKIEAITKLGKVLIFYNGNFAI